jgi:hypothetical protein
VWSRNLENEEAKARYRAVENTPTMGCNAKKTNNKLVVTDVSRQNMGPIFKGQAD